MRKHDMCKHERCPQSPASLRGNVLIPFQEFLGTKKIKIKKSPAILWQPSRFIYIFIAKPESQVGAVASIYCLY